MCMYEIYNPRPGNTLYVNLYRLTNNSDIGIYFKDPEVGDAQARKSPLLPSGYKESIQEYVPGEWRENATVPVESYDQNSWF